MIVIPTIQHTGTFFALSLFPDFEVCHFRGEPESDRAVFYDHVWPGEWKHLEPLLKIYPALVPIRHPWSVALSWIRRGRDLTQLDSQFEQMQRVDYWKPCYLPLDTEDRSEWIESARDRLNLPLATDWKPRHVKRYTHMLDWRRLCPPDEVVEALPHAGWIIHKFYGGGNNHASQE